MSFVNDVGDISVDDLLDEIDELEDLVAQLMADKKELVVENMELRDSIDVLSDQLDDCHTWYAENGAEIAI